MTWEAQQPGIVTPEAVRLDLNLADAGSRGTALLIDSLIQLGVIMFLALFMSGYLFSDAGMALGAFIYLCVFCLYFLFFEGLWNGQTPGKRSQKLRVTRMDGQPITMKDSVVRNLLRLVDALFFYVVGLVTILATSKRQRLGDLAGGTVVINERKLAPPAPLLLPPAPPGAPTVDASGITPAEYDVVRAYLVRRPSLSLAVAAGLAMQIATPIRARVGGGAMFLGTDDAFLEAVARAYVARSQELP